ncbi:MAG: DUF4339 domain-containing protein [Prevotella sp.]|nr:DUF4339 domain-containing protein [Prevotella sp.]
MLDDSNFFSLDRLVEFGMSASIAQQMVTSMNQQMQQMQYPGSLQNMPQPQPGVYYVAIDGQPNGPLDEKELARLIYDRKVTKDTLCWLPGMAQWKPVSEVPAVLRIVALTPPPLSPY